MTEPCETCGGPASDEEVAGLYARLERRGAHASRWKALARRLRERLIIRRRLISGMAGLQDLLLKAECDLAAARESHARELMESAARYGAQIERLQRERDEAVTAHATEKEWSRAFAADARKALDERDREREAHAATRRDAREAYREKGERGAHLFDMTEERDALAERVRVLEQNNRDAEGRYDACYAELTRVREEWSRALDAEEKP